MKYILIIAFTMITFNSFSQDTTKVEQYCRVILTTKFLSSKINIDVDFGQTRGFLTDQRIRDEETGKLKNFNSITDALNYMGARGWSLINAFPLAVDKGESYHFYFKKLFPKRDMPAANDQ